MALLPRVGGSWIGLEVNNSAINWDPKDITIHGSKESWIVSFWSTKAHTIATQKNVAIFWHWLSELVAAISRQDSTKFIIIQASVDSVNLTHAKFFIMGTMCRMGVLLHRVFAK